MNPLVCLGAARDGAPVVHVPDKGAQAPHEPPCHHLLSLDEMEEDQVGTNIFCCHIREWLQMVKMIERDSRTDLLLSFVFHAGV